MKSIYKLIIILIIVLIAVGGTLLLINNNSHQSGDGISYNATALSEKLTIDMNNWNYDEENDIYYQIGLVYCANPATINHESCGIYVPGDYFKGIKNPNGTYTCTINENSKVGNYSANSAPIVIPVNTPGYSAQEAPTEYNPNEVKEYIDAGFIYLNAGCRGRDNGDNFTGGAPWGITDLKSAITYYRFNGDLLPGDNEKIFSFGHSGGGAQSALLGTTGNSELYNPYLENIGAAMVDKDGNILSNAIYGSMCWCPITSLDTADEAYEWNLGQYSNSGTRADGTFTKELSDDLASEYANYINNLNLKDPNGNTLTLEESDNGIYTKGSYYEYLLQTTEESLNNFLNDTTFPYTPSSGMSDSPGMDMNNNVPSMGGEMPNGEAPDNTGNAQNIRSSSETSDSSSYNSAKEYIDSLNGNDTWIEYDENTNTAKIKSIEAFVKHCKSPSKDVGAFDDLSKSQAENTLFGNGDEDELHFDSILSNLLTENSDKYSKYSDYNSEYANNYSSDLKKTDSLNNTVDNRVDLYNPMYHLCDYYDGKDTSDIAHYWRINSGIEQGDTAQTVEMNLYLALVQKIGKDNVEFNTVWEQGHTQAERSGDAASNFINWVNNCLN